MAPPHLTHRERIVPNFRIIAASIEPVRVRDDKCLGLLKSVPGHSRRFGRPPVTSGLHRQTDIFGARWHVSKVPHPDMISHGRTLRALGSVDAKHRLSLLGSRNWEA